MKTRKNAGFVLFFLVLMANPQMGFCLFENSSDAFRLAQEAQELRQKGAGKVAEEKLAEAENILLKPIRNHPPGSDQERFDLGMFYFKYRKNEDEAFKLFLGVKNNPQLAPQAGNLFLEKAKEFGRTNNEFGMNIMLSKAFQVCPQMKSEYIGNLFQTGKASLKSGDFRKADLNFKLACQVDSSKKQEANEIFTQMALTVPWTSFVDFARAAKWYGTWGNERIEKRLLEIIKTVPETDRVDFKSAVNGLVGANIYAAAFPPDYKVYQPGTYTFTLKAGETLNPGVEFSPGRKGKYSVISKDNNFKLIYSDGDVVPGNADKAPAKDFPKFKIYAITDQKDIVMVVK